MTTGAMLAIAEQMDRCGFESVEFFGVAAPHRRVLRRAGALDAMLAAGAPKEYMSARRPPVKLIREVFKR